DEQVAASGCSCANCCCGRWCARNIPRRVRGLSIGATWETASVTATSARAVQALSRTTGGGAGRSRRLVGRDRELAELAEPITSSALTTVTGPGGVGKTALALAVAAASSGHFPDGVFVVWLASLRSADLVAGEIAARVGMQRSGGKSNEDA